MIADMYLIRNGSDDSLKERGDYKEFAYKYSLQGMYVGKTTITLFRDGEGLHLK